ncbi:hypothetical protein AOLI_G00152790 [Acnodon oligacanthus]
MSSTMSSSGEEQPAERDQSVIQRQRRDSPEPSRVSMKSDWSMDHPLCFREGDRSPAERVQKETSEVISGDHLESVVKEPSSAREGAHLRSMKEIDLANPPQSMSERRPATLLSHTEGYEERMKS